MPELTEEARIVAIDPIVEASAVMLIDCCY